MSIASEYDLEAIKARNKYLEDQLEAVKPILKQIQSAPGSLPPRVKLKELHLNAQWLRVWRILGVND